MVGNDADDGFVAEEPEGDFVEVEGEEGAKDGEEYDEAGVVGEAGEEGFGGHEFGFNNNLVIPTEISLSFYQLEM